VINTIMLTSVLGSKFQDSYMGLAREVVAQTRAAGFVCQLMTTKSGCLAPNRPSSLVCSESRGE
jgi:hypothetical protein